MMPAVASWTRPRLLSGVDHGDSGGADRDVVDVRPAASADPAVVQHDHVAAGEPDRERPRGRCFSFGSLSPRLHVAWLSGERCHD
jgi:hypothetical protein